MKKKPAPAPLPAPEDSALFRAAVSDAIRLPDPGRVTFAAPAIPAFQVQSPAEEHDELFDFPGAAPPGTDASLQWCGEASYLRGGASRQVLKKLRRGHWGVQAHIDLHGMNREEARAHLGRFLAQVMLHDQRCVRIIHGKGLGSQNREPVLRAKVRAWLANCDEVLAYCEAPDTQGGAGAMLVLLRA